jgi:hypothetical protein
VHHRRSRAEVEIERSALFSLTRFTNTSTSPGKRDLKWRLAVYVPSAFGKLLQKRRREIQKRAITGARKSLSPYYSELALVLSGQVRTGRSLPARDGLRGSVSQGRQIRPPTQMSTQNSYPWYSVPPILFDGGRGGRILNVRFPSPESGGYFMRAIRSGRRLSRSCSKSATVKSYTSWSFKKASTCIRVSKPSILRS